MTKKQKLELTWIGKENRPRLEPRILLEDPEKSYHAKHRVTESDIFDNRLIFGDNLLALKALEQEFTGKIKCIFIDPPYNTGSAFSHYDDGVEHSIWLSLMRDRLELLRKMLSEDGAIWITIDDNECHYLKILCDEVFGRQNFVANVIWEKKSSSQSNATWLSDSHDHVLLFAKNKEIWRPAKLARTSEQNAIYKHSDQYDGIDTNGKKYGRGPWFPGDFTISLTTGQRGKQFAKTGVSANLYPITTPSGRETMPAKGRCWAYTKDSFERLKADNRVYFGKGGSSKPTIKRFLSEIEDQGVVCPTVWHYSEVGENRIAAVEVKAFNEADPFSAPKPELLLKRILELSTNPLDWVLDSFAGSGTTGAVAHKMGRRWIMVELGEHCHTHIIPRLQKVIDGADPGGVTEAVGWKGGGGFRYYRLAPSLLEKDKWGNWVISRDFNAAMLAEAVCKLEGFTYAPSDTVYWQHGHSTERDFIYVTTQNLGPDQLSQLSDEVGPDRTLLVLCAAFRAGTKDVGERYPNLTVKKIPKQVLSRCEWGHDDYSLKVENLPKAPPPVDKRGQMGLI
ncbi:MAG TPA: site-specific DNA-methyltransferase [Candidatus Sulfotelmatobacter sp.]|nr:site-specific DNA-methyltransferase [Candidatus Sulfotelmatobacter sp.]